MLNITEEQLYIAWTSSLICKSKGTFAFHSRKAVKCERKVSPSNLSFKGLSPQCRTYRPKENLCVSVLVWYTTIPVDHNLIYTLKHARQPAQIWEILALSPLSVPPLTYSGVIFSSVITDRKGVISKGTLVPTEQSKWHLWAWHADTAVPVCCRIWVLTTNCSWGWLRTFKREYFASQGHWIVFIHAASLKNIACVTLGKNLQRNRMGCKNVCVYTHVFIFEYTQAHIHNIVTIQHGRDKMPKDIGLGSWYYPAINGHCWGSSLHLNNPGMPLELRLKDQLCVVDCGVSWVGKCWVASDDPMSGMICKSAVYDAYRILLMVILLITTYSKKQSNEKSHLKCQE